MASKQYSSAQLDKFVESLQKDPSDANLDRTLELIEAKAMSNARSSDARPSVRGGIEDNKLPEFLPAPVVLSPMEQKDNKEVSAQEMSLMKRVEELMKENKNHVEYAKKLRRKLKSHENMLSDFVEISERQDAKMAKVIGANQSLEKQIEELRRRANEEPLNDDAQLSLQFEQARDQNEALQKRIEELERENQQVSQLSNEVKHLQKTEIELTGAFYELYGDMKQVENKKEAFERQIEGFQQENEELRGNLFQMENQNEKMSKQVKELKKNLGKSKSAVEDKEPQFAYLSSKVAKLEEQLIQQERENMKETSVKDALEKEIKQLVGKSRDLQNDVLHLESKNTELAKELSELEKMKPKFAGLNAEIEQLQQKLKTRESDMQLHLKKRDNEMTECSQNMKKDLDKQIEELELKNEQLRNDVVNMESHKKEMSEENTDLKILNNELELIIKDLEPQLLTLNTGVEQLGDDLTRKETELEFQKEDFEKEIKELQQKNQQLGNGVVNMEIKNSDLEKELKIKEKELEDVLNEVAPKFARLNAEVDTLEQKLKRKDIDMEQHLEKKDKEMTAWSQNMKKDLDKQIEELELKNEQLRNGVVTMESHKKELSEENTDLKILNNELEVIIKDMEPQLLSLNTGVEQLGDDLTRKETELEFQKEDFEKEIKELQQKNQQLGNGVVNMENKNSDLEKELKIKEKELEDVLNEVAPKFARLNAEVDTLEQKLKRKDIDMEQHLEKKDKEMTEWSQNMKKDLDKQIEELELKNEQLRNGVVAMESQKKQLSEENTDLKILNNDLELIIKDMEPQLLSLNTGVEQLGDDLTRKETEFEFQKEDFEKEIKELQQKNQQLSNGVENKNSELLAEGQVQKRKETELQAALKEIQPKFNFFKEEVDKLNKQLKDSKACICELEGELKKKKPQTEELQEENKQLRTMNMELSADVEVLETKEVELHDALEQTQPELCSLKEEVENLNQELMDSKDYVCELEEAMNKKVSCHQPATGGLLEENEKLQRAMFDLKRQNKELLAEMQYIKTNDTELQDTLTEVGPDFDLLKEQVEKLNQQLMASDDRMYELRDKMDKKLTIKMKQMEVSSRSGDKSLEKLRQENKQLRNEVLRMDKKNKELLAEMEDSRMRAKNNLQGVVEDMRPDFDYLTDNVQKEDQQPHVPTPVYKLEGGLKEKDPQVEELQQENKQLRNSMLQMASTNRDLSAEVQDLEIKDNEHKKALQEIHPEFMHLKEEVARLNKQLEDAKDCICELEGELKKKKPQTEELQEENKQLRTMNMELSADVEALELKDVELHDALEQTQPELCSLKEEVENLNQELMDSKDYVCELEEAMNKKVSCHQPATGGLLEENEKLQRAMFDLKRQNKELLAEMQYIKTNDTELQDTLTEVGPDFELLKEQVEKLNQQLMASDDRMYELRDKMDKKLTVKMKQMEVSSQSGDKSLEKLRQENKQLRNEVLRMDKKNKELLAEMEDSRMRAKNNLQGVVEDMRPDFDYLTDKVQKEDQQLMDYTDPVYKPEGGLKEKDPQVEELQQENKQLRNSMLQMASTNRDLSAEVHDLEIKDNEHKKALQEIHPEFMHQKEEVARLNKQLEDAKDRICNLNKKKKKVTFKVEENEKEEPSQSGSAGLEHLRQENEQLRNEVFRMDNKNRELWKAIQDLRTKAKNKLRGVLEEIRPEFDYLTDKVEKQDQQLKDYTDRICELEESLQQKPHVEELQAENEQLHNSLFQMETQNKDLVEEIEDLEETHPDFTFLKEEIETLKQELMDSNDCICELEETLKKKTLRKESPQMGNNDLENEIEELKGENKQLRNAVIDVESQNIELAVEVDNLTLKERELQDELDEFKPQFIFLHNEVQDLEKQLMDSKDRVSELEDELKGKYPFRKKERETRRQEQLGNHIKQVQEENEQLRNAFFDMESEKNELSEELDNLRVKEGELHGAVNKIQSQFDCVYNQAEKLYRDLVDSKHRVALLEGELENKPPASEEVKERSLETTTNKLWDAKKRIQHLEQDFATELQNRNHAAGKQLSEWMEKLQQENSLKDDFIQFQNQHVVRLTSYLKIAKQQIEELDQKYQEKRELLHKETQNLNGDVGKLEGDVKRFREKALEYSKQLSNTKNMLYEQVEEATKIEYDMREAFEQVCPRFRGLVVEVAALEQQLKDAHGHARDLEDALEKEKKTSKDEIARLQQQLTLNTKRSKVEVAKRNTNFADAISDEVHQVKQSLEMEMEVLHRENTSHIELRNEYNRQLASSEEQRLLLEQKNQFMEDEVAQKRREKKVLRKQIDSLQIENEQLQYSVLQVESEKEHLTREVEKLNLKQKSAQNATKQVKPLISRMRAKSVELHEQLVGSQNHISEIEDQLQHEQAEKGDLKKEYEEFKRALATLATGPPLDPPEAPDIKSESHELQEQLFGAEKACLSFAPVGHGSPPSLPSRPPDAKVVPTGSAVPKTVSAAVSATSVPVMAVSGSTEAVTDASLGKPSTCYRQSLSVPAFQDGQMTPMRYPPPKGVFAASAPVMDLSGSPGELTHTSQRMSPICDMQSLSVPACDGDSKITLRCPPTPGVSAAASAPESDEASDSPEVLTLDSLGKLRDRYRQTLSMAACNDDSNITLRCPPPPGVSAAASAPEYDAAWDSPEVLTLDSPGKLRDRYRQTLSMAACNDDSKITLRCPPPPGVSAAASAPESDAASDSPDVLTLDSLGKLRDRYRKTLSMAACNDDSKITLRCPPPSGVSAAASAPESDAASDSPEVLTLDSPGKLRDRYRHTLSMTARKDGSRITFRRPPPPRVPATSAHGMAVSSSPEAVTPATPRKPPTLYRQSLSMPARQDGYKISERRPPPTDVPTASAPVMAVSGSPDEHTLASPGKPLTRYKQSLSMPARKDGSKITFRRPPPPRVSATSAHGMAVSSSPESVTPASARKPSTLYRQSLSMPACQDGYKIPERRPPPTDVPTASAPVMAVSGSPEEHTLASPGKPLTRYKQSLSMPARKDGSRITFRRPPPPRVSATSAPGMAVSSSPETVTPASPSKPSTLYRQSLSMPACKDGSKITLRRLPPLCVLEDATEATTTLGTAAATAAASSTSVLAAYQSAITSAAAGIPVAAGLPTKSLNGQRESLSVPVIQPHDATSSHRRTVSSAACQLPNSTTTTRAKADTAKSRRRQPSLSTVSKSRTKRLLRKPH